MPARQAGTPCWNSEYSGVDYRGLASENENVRLCWHGGSAARGHGGGFLNNHNWVEYYDPADGAWHFVNVPPGTKAPDAGLCGDDFAAARGCGYNASAPPGADLVARFSVQETLPPGQVRGRRETRCPRPRHGPGAQFHGDDVHAAAGHARRGARGLLGGLTEQLVIYIGQ